MREACARRRCRGHHALSAVHTNEIRLEYLGIPVWAVLLIAYVVSAALAGLGGALAGFAIGRVVPDFAFWTASGHLVLIAVLGGIGGVPGAFIGALFLELLHSAAVTVTDSWNLIVGMRRTLLFSAILLGVTVMTQTTQAATPDPATDPRIAPQVRAFLKEINKDSSPFWELPQPKPQDILTGLQNKTPVDMASPTVPVAGVEPSARLAVAAYSVPPVDSRTKKVVL